MKSHFLLLLFLALPLGAQVNITQQPDQISVEIDGKPYTTFYLAPGGNKPYVYPLRTASGIVVTRHFPMEQFPGEIQDHPHHRGMFFSHGDINGFNFWATEPGGKSTKRASMVLKKVIEAKGGSKSGTIKTVFDGLDPQGKPIMTETRTLVFHSDPKLRIIDYEIQIDPLETLKFGDTKEGTFGIRLATSMQENKSGRMVNAEGQETEKNVWGKRSVWVDYYGQVDGQTVGVAVLDHPSNPRHPTYWHSRAYGLLGANIFGVHDFENDKTKDGSLTVNPGQALRFRYRVVIHPGDTRAAGIAALAASFSQPQTEAKRSAGKQWNSDPEWQEVRYGAWGGPGVNPAPGAMDSMLLKDYSPKSSVVTPETPVPKARYPAIDVHTHVLARTPEEVAEWVKTMDEVGIETSVVLTSATGASFDKLVELYLAKYPARFQLYCGLLTTDIDKPDYPERAAAELVRCYKKGARGVGELSDKGSGFGRGTGVARDKRLHPDDPRLDAFWNKCAELKIPINIHVSDHPSCWKPLDVYQERTPDYQHFNQYGKDLPSYEELLAIRDRTLARHPKNTFIACHLGNQGNDLASLGKVLDTYSNLYLDISARDYEVGRAPRAAVKFLTKYRNRVLFGTDMGREKRMFQAWWRLFETADEYMPGRVWWRYYGLELPAPVLESLYRGTAKKVLNWEKP